MTATRRSHHTSQTPVSCGGAHAIPASPAETEHLSFEFWYTRIFGYYTDHVSMNNLTTGLRKVIIEYSESDPSVLEELLETPFGWIENNIVAFYEPLSSTLIYKRDLLQVRNMTLPLGEHTVWSAVYKKPRKFSVPRTISWTIDVLQPGCHPVLYIEDLERGRYNNNIWRCFSSWVGDGIAEICQGRFRSI
ncbi:hypothetical protein TWF679_004731 [Orbilia oligospora]|uniref:Uncharacterized protein n=1 Tax=Orbilia oligospora TaxID=2813651 RepID=A0A8H8UPW2_ORBOL|nr:hypothetical protein TWF679_004731 [Orbilia oligospora]